jgi:hypothetical protein
MAQARVFRVAEIHLESTEFAIRVIAPQPDLEWLSEFFSPGLEPGTADAASEDVITVQLNRDASRHESLKDACRAENGQVAGKPVPTFAGHKHYQELVLYRDPEDLYHDPEFNTFIRLHPAESRIELTAWGDDLKARITLMRVVRELWTSALQRTGALITHASCCDIEGSGILISGPKSTGKTSVATHLLHHEGVRFVANDRVALVPGQGEQAVRAVGIATIVAFKPGSLRLFPCVRREPWKHGWLHRSSLAELTVGPGSTGDWPDDLVYNLSPAQYLHQLEAEALPATRIHLVLFPKVCNDRKGVHFTEVASSEARKRLTHQQFPQAGSIFHDFTQQKMATKQLPKGFSMADIMAFDCELGMGAYHSGMLFSRVRKLMKDHAP